MIEQLNAMRGGMNEALGIRFVSATYERVVAELDIGPHHLQPYGLVHGGVYASMIETLASTGAAINAMLQGRQAVGLENSTSFLRAVRSGRLRGIATPLSRGRRSQVWQVTISDDDDRPVAIGRVRMLCFEQGATIAGESVTVKSNPALDT